MRLTRRTKLAIVALLVAAAVLVSLLARREAGLVHKIVLRPSQFKEEGLVLDVNAGELKCLEEALSLNAPCIGLPLIERSRTHGGLWTALTEPEYTYSAHLDVGNLDLEFAPADKKGNPLRDYWADKTCAKWPNVPQRRTSFYRWTVEWDKIGYPILFRTCDGATGVLKVVKIDRQRVRLRYRILEWAEPCAPRKQSTPQKRFIASLPNGVGVELVAIACHPSAASTWWKPDGSPIKRAPYFNKRAKLFCSDDMAAYEIAYRYVSPVGALWPGAPVASIPRALAWARLDPRDEFGNEGFSVGAGAFSVKKDDPCVTIRIGIVTGEPQTLLVTKGGAETHRLADKSISISPPRAGSNGQFVVDVNLSKAWGDDYSIRLAAVDCNDEIHYLAKGHEFAAAADPRLLMQQWHPFFSDQLRGSEVKEFHFDVRPYQWAIFRNVSLRPGEDHGLEIDVEPARAEDANTAPTS